MRSFARRTLICGAIGAGAAVAGAGRTRAGAAQFEFRCSSDLPVDHSVAVRLRQMWAAIERESGGRVHTQFFPNNELGSAAAVFSQLRLGALHFQELSSPALSSVVPSFDVCNIGFVYNNEAEGDRAVDGALGQYLGREAAAKGLYLFPTTWNAGMYEIGANSRQIRGPDDLRGFKIRTPQSKITVDLFKTFGASPTPVGFDEVYTALQTKLIDGESAPVTTIAAARFNEINKYISLTNHNWANVWLIANADVWKSIPPDLQNVIGRNNRKYALLARRDQVQLDPALQGKLARQGIVFNQVAQDPFRARLGAYFDEASKIVGSTAMDLLQSSLGRKLTS